MAHAIDNRNELLEAARNFRARGWHVIPARPRDKRPAVPTWREFQAEPPTPDQIDVWWEERPDANVALLTGRGLVVIDLDGAGARELLDAAGVEIPDGAGWVETGNGWHVYLATPPGEVIGNKAAILRGTVADPATGKLPQVDVRGDGGYVIAPPSIHPSGRRYRWGRDGMPTGELPVIPDALLELVRPKVQPATANTSAPSQGTPQATSAPPTHGSVDPWVTKALQGVGEGMRDDTCTKLAGYFVPKLPTDVVIGILTGFASRCRPPLPESDVRRVVESVTKKHLGAGGTVPGGEAPASDRFRFINDAELENIPTIPWLVDRVVPRGGLFMIFGAPGSLKTFLALLLSFCVALGQSFYGHNVERGPVVYVAAEGGAGLSVRVRVLRLWLRLVGEAAGVHFVTEAVNLSDTDDVEAFIAQAKPLAPFMVIFDTLARNAAGVEENSATEMGRVIGAVDYIRQSTGAAVGFIHHPTKSGLTERGSSALRGAVDALLQVVREGDAITVTAEKLKDAEPFEPMKFRSKRIELEDGESSLVLEPIDDDGASPREAPMTLPAMPGHARMILETLRDAFGNDGTSATLLWRTTGIPKERSFYHSLRKVREWGFVIQSGRRYQLSRLGQELFI